MKQVEDIKVGDFVDVVDADYQYTSYSTWLEDLPWKGLWTHGSDIRESTGTLEVVYLGDHKYGQKLALVQDDTEQVFIMGVEGISIVGEGDDSTAVFKEFSIEPRKPYLSPEQVKVLMKAAAGMEYDDSREILRVVYEVVTGNTDWEE